jgi:hypothetical protein
MMKLTFAVFIFFLSIGRFALADKLDDMLANSSVGLSPETVSLLRSDFNLLKSMKGVQASALSDTIFGTNGKFDGEVYLKFFLDRVDDIEFGGCPAEAVACQVPGTRISHLTSLYATIPPVVRLSTLLHESIHGSSFGDHASCPSVLVDEFGAVVKTTTAVPIAGLKACADNISDPYVAQYIFLQNIVSNCLTCTQSAKADAKQFLLNLKPLIINADVLKAIKEDR